MEGNSVFIGYIGGSQMKESSHSLRTQRLHVVRYSRRAAPRGKPVSFRLNPESRQPLKTRRQVEQGLVGQVTIVLPSSCRCSGNEKAFFRQGGRAPVSSWCAASRSWAERVPPPTQTRITSLSVRHSCGVFDDGFPCRAGAAATRRPSSGNEQCVRQECAGALEARTGR